MVCGWILMGMLATDTRAPQQLYERHCAACHGLDQSGRTADGVRLPGIDLTDAKRRANLKLDDTTRLILQGRGAMPSFKHKVSEKEAAALAAECLKPLSRTKRPPKPKPRTPTS